MDLRIGAEVPMTLNKQRIRRFSMNAPESLKGIRFKYGLAKNGGQFTEMPALPHNTPQTKQKR